MGKIMKQQFGLIRRPWGVFYLKNKITGEQTSLKTRDKGEAERLLAARNESQSQPSLNLALARVYINGADPKLGTRTWQEVMEHIVAKKTDETRRRWEVAVKDRNLDCIRNLAVVETRPEHFDRALADGKVSTNVYLRRIHNHALGMEWLLKSVIPRLQWPKPVYGEKRAIRSEEHTAIVARELNLERRDFYELLWHTGASQSDAAFLMAEDVDWNSRTICYLRKKLKSRGGTAIKPALIRFGVDVEGILRGRPSAGALFPYLRTVRAGDRATEYKQRCEGLGIQGVSLHSYRYVWAERSADAGDIRSAMPSGPWDKHQKSFIALTLRKPKANCHRWKLMKTRKKAAKSKPLPRFNAVAWRNLRCSAVAAPLVFAAISVWLTMFPFLSGFRTVRPQDKAPALGLNKIRPLSQHIDFLKYPHHQALT
jgi:integrase